MASLNQHRNCCNGSRSTVFSSRSWMAFSARDSLMLLNRYYLQPAHKGQAGCAVDRESAQSQMYRGARKQAQNEHARSEVQLRTRLAPYAQAASINDSRA